MIRYVTTVSLALVASAALAAQKAPEAVRETFDEVGGALPEGWRAVRGTWRTEDGALVAEALRGEGMVTVGDERWQNYEIEVRATFLKVREPTRWLSVVFRASKDGAPPWSQFPMRQATKRRNGLEFAVRGPRGWSVRARAKGPSGTKIGQARHLRVVVQGDRVACFLDGKLRIESLFCVDRARGCVGLAVSGCVARFDDFVVRRLPDSPARPPVAARVGACACVAHRGFSAAAPENTLAAVRKAVEAGADGCEFDVYASKDGVAVLMHDATVDRTTDGKGKVTGLSLAELKKLDAGSWKGKQFAGEPVPTLLDVLKALKGTGCRAVIEVKTDGIAQAVVDAVREADMVDSSVVISFKDQAVADARKLEAALPGALVVGGSRRGSTAEWAATLAARARKCGAAILDLNYQMLSPELVADLHERGFKVWCWTVNDEAVMAALARWGVDGITTDRPDAMVRWRKKLLEKTKR